MRFTCILASACGTITFPAHSMYVLPYRTDLAADASCASGLFGCIEYILVTLANLKPVSLFVSFSCLAVDNFSFFTRCWPNDSCHAHV